MNPLEEKLPKEQVTRWEMKFQSPAAKKSDSYNGGLMNFSAHRNLHKMNFSWIFIGTKEILLFSDHNPRLSDLESTLRYFLTDCRRTPQSLNELHLVVSLTLTGNPFSLLNWDQPLISGSVCTERSTDPTGSACLRFDERLMTFVKLEGSWRCAEQHILEIYF